MTIGINLSLREARLNLILSAIDLGADEYDGALLSIYSGVRPFTGEELDEYDIALVTFMLPFPCGSIVNGVLTFNTILDSVGITTGVASWGRLVDSNGDFVMDLSVTDIYGSGDIKIDSTDINAGSLVHCHSAIITEGNV